MLNMLSFSPFPINVDSSNFKIDTDGSDVVAGERVVGKPDEKRRLSDARIANDEKLSTVSLVCFFGSGQVWR